MPKEDSLITPEKRKDMPPRGKGKQTLILDSIKEKALLSMNKDSTRDDVEKAIFGFMAESAFQPTEDTAAMSSFCLGQLMKKGWPDMKSVMPVVEFDFDKDATPSIQAAQVMHAASKGELPPDVANVFVSSIASMLKIEEVTELQKRLEAIETELGIGNG